MSSAVYPMVRQAAAKSILWSSRLLPNAVYAVHLPPNLLPIGSAEPECHQLAC